MEWTKRSIVAFCWLCCGVSHGFFLNPLTGLQRSSSNSDSLNKIQSPSHHHYQHLYARVPPEFTIEDTDEDEERPMRVTAIPSDFSSDDEQSQLNSQTVAPQTIPKEVKMPAAALKSNTLDSTYSEEESSSVSTGRRRVRKAPRITRMAPTNWMEKNEKFSPDDMSGKMKKEREPEVTTGNQRDGMKEARSRMDTKTFRQDFRGTRVFVQGIPDGTSWQDLKDHFKVAGNVVFASVSVDSQTGMTKGHGIVQFETTQMAQNAIDIMREYPLFGSKLFVREDVQENSDPNAKLANAAPKGPTPPTKWKCANEDNAQYLSPEDLKAIRSLIKARDESRRRRNYDISDRIRDELKFNHGVFIDDRLKMWWTAVDGNKVPQSIQDIKGDGRWKLEPWRQIPTTPENDACINPDLVEGLLKQRDVARREKDFSTADALLEEARTSPDGDLTLRIHDESRTWRIWTDAPPPRSSFEPSHEQGGDPKDRAVKECIAIVKEYAPHKMEEITTVLEKFEGREYQILKRLKKQYL